GAFLAGISLASIPYNLEIESKAVSLRDFFSTIFFVTIGMQITFANFEFWIIPIILFSLFVLIGNPLIIFISTLFLGLTARTAFLSSIALAQISEFSLVFIALAYQLKLVPHEILSFTALIALITFTVSTYLITYDGTLYLWFKPLLDKINHLTNQKDKKSHTPKNFLPEIILCGYGRVGKKIKQSLKNKKILIVEFDPEIINKLKKNIPVIYGDVGDDELLKNLPLKKVKMVISTIGDFYDTKRLIKHIKIFNKNIKIIVSAVESDDALQLYDFGADYVIVPHLIGGEYVSLLLHKGLNDVKHLFYKKQEHIDELRKV
ncbi:sodium:proton exchanger, partial [Candidatus Woesearchaeota archaeon CG10_big_fil_rev_8_21_14_0_10_30_7]